MASTAGAQTAFDQYQISQNDLRGTARFMSMAGAFGALGGDLSTLTQNPGGIGVYRSSEVGITVDFNFQQSSTQPTAGNGYGVDNTQTKVYCNNFGYVGTVALPGSTMPYFNWGVTYSRAASFDRRYRGNLPTINGSLTNYVAGYTSAEAWTESELSAYQSNYNPYQDGMAPWMSILFYNNYLINPTGGNTYGGLYNGTAGYGEYEVSEKGYVDEYSINFGGNIANTVYWGMGIGVTDLNYTSDVFYQETYDPARVPNSDATGVTTGYGGYGLSSWRHIWGTGVNFKVGVIVKPINELRIGLAVHTPTYYNIQQEGMAVVDYDINGQYYPDGYYAKTDYGYSDYFEWKSRTPWRLIASAAGVIDGRFIISGDYEYRPYQAMWTQSYDGWDYTDVNDDINNYYQASNIVRLGAEFRVTPQVSLRAGYSYESTPVTTAMENGNLTAYTSGPDDTETTPSYTLDKSTQYITAGLGYRYKGFYIDAAYVHKHRASTFHGYTEVASDGSYTGSPSSNVTDNNNSLVLSIGYKF